MVLYFSDHRLPLTSRGMQVLELLAAGSPNQEIANDLVVTIDTVKKHVTRARQARRRQPH